jgi:AmiR/NasT family two-component response regulator
MATGERGKSIEVSRGALSVSVPSDTPPEAIAEIERLLELLDSLADRTAQLHVALDSRVVIEQAKGVLAERLSISPEQAFDILRRAARSKRASLHAVADAVVRGEADGGA